jgi:predicted TIM-barrel fold metal-dependent hydrolase
MSTNLTSPLLAAKSTDEYTPQPPSAAVRQAAAQFAERVATIAPKLGLSPADHAFDRRGTATALRALDAAHGGGYFPLDEATETDEDAAAAAFSGTAPVIDVQTHFIDPARWDRPGAEGLAWFLTTVDQRRWGGGVDPHLIDAAEWATLVFGTSETAVALLTSTPGPAEDNVLTNPQIAAARDIMEKYGASGRVLTHTIVHPNLGPGELEQMADWQAQLSPSGWKVYTLYGPPTAASPTGGWFLDDEEIGMPFLEQVRALGPRVVACHKGLGGPIPSASVAAASPRDIGPAAAAFPDIDFVVYHSGYEQNPEGEEGPYDPAAPNDGVDRLVASVEAAGIGPGGNVYAELGSTWYLILRRPAEAAHVLGKLLRSLGPDRIVWGTDSIWYGSPQPLIDAFRSFQIPESFQEQFGYPALTTEIKEKILSHNARRVYRVSDAALVDAAGSLGASASWVGGASVELRRAMSAQGTSS